MNAAALPLRVLAHWLIGTCALACWSTAAWSSDATAAMALQALLGPQAAFQQTGGMPPTPAHSAGGAAHNSVRPSSTSPANATLEGMTVTVQRGETLDRLIRRTLPNVPLHPDFLRKAFVSLNPQVFPSGSPHQMRSGASLKVPSLPALRQMMLNQYPGSAPLLGGPQALAAEGAATEANDQRRWVRFP